VTWSWASCSFKTASWLASAEIVAVVPAEGEVSLSSGVSRTSSAVIWLWSCCSAAMMALRALLRS